MHSVRRAYYITVNCGLTVNETVRHRDIHGHGRVSLGSLGFDKDLHTSIDYQQLQSLELPR